MTVMPFVRLILYMSRVDGDTTGLFFGSFVNLRVVGELRTTLLRENFGDGCGQSCLSVVDVTNGANVHVRLCTREFASCLRVATAKHLVIRSDHMQGHVFSYYLQVGATWFRAAYGKVEDAANAFADTNGVEKAIFLLA